MPPILIAVIAVVLIVFLYVGTMLLNDKAGVPEGCEQAYLEAQECESCHVAGTDSCGLTKEPMFQEALEFMKEVKL